MIVEIRLTKLRLDYIVNPGNPPDHGLQNRPVQGTIECGPGFSLLSLLLSQPPIFYPLH